MAIVYNIGDTSRLREVILYGVSRGECQLLCKTGNVNLGDSY